jgi:hypothetical protein
MVMESHALGCTVCHFCPQQHAIRCGRRAFGGVEKVVARIFMARGKGGSLIMGFARFY